MKDINGTKLEVNDKVAVVIPKYSELKVGRILRFSKVMAAIEIGEDDGWSKIISRSSNQIAKINDNRYLLAIGETGGICQAHSYSDYCMFCNSNIGNGEPHQSGCEYIEVIKTDIWKEFQEKRKVDDVNSELEKNGLVFCSYCNKLIHKASLKHHQRNSNNCKKIQQVVEDK